MHLVGGCLGGRGGGGERPATAPLEGGEGRGGEVAVAGELGRAGDVEPLLGGGAEELAAQVVLGVAGVLRRGLARLAHPELLADVALAGGGRGGQR